MRAFGWLVWLILVSLTSFAADVSYHGSKPDFIIDVRTAEEYAAGHIDGALNIPVDRIAQDWNSVKGLKPGSTVLLYCRSGRRSAIAADALRKQGFQRVLDGGGIETLSRSLKPCVAGAC